MPAYNFQKQFAPMIPERKWHTVRRKRKHPTKVGDALYLYTGMRTKQCRLIVELPCLFIKPIEIYPDEMQVMLDDVQLSVDEVNSFFYHDGFDDAYDFFDFFRRYPPDVRENELEAIYWR